MRSAWLAPLAAIIYSFDMRGCEPVNVHFIRIITHIVWSNSNQLDLISGFPATSATALVIITVVDENDTPPSFTDQFIFQVKENCKIGSVVGYMTATDPDKNTTLR
jgi:hypothetical protein